MSNPMPNVIPPFTWVAVLMFGAALLDPTGRRTWLREVPFARPLHSLLPAAEYIYPVEWLNVEPEEKAAQGRD
jgi:hypothetical protein